MLPRSAPPHLLAALLGVVACNATPGDGQTDGAGGSSTTSTGGDATNGTDTTTNEAGTGDIHGPVGEWVWHDVPGAICANGTPTGLGVNQGAGDRLVIYMSGGSACLDEGCSIGTPSMRKDGGFGAAELAECVAGDCDGSVTFPGESIFDRSAATNPFSDATFVFISNCAGDYYVGDNDHAFPGWTAQFHGSRNQRLFAAALAASFPAASRVILTGGSAGSVGAMLNYWQWVEAFPGTRVDLVSDSFAFVFADGPEWRYELHDPQVPPGCTTCAADYRTVYEFNASLAPDSRIAVLDAENNWTLDLVTGYQYTAGLQALQTRLDDLPNLRYYVANGDEHILLQHPLDSDAINVERDGDAPQRLSEFLAQMQSDDPAWASMTCLAP
ncbi:pectin acetylesterase-family hydrolase [Nannocystis pusilla]|uniref:pectin acetylesterase-family hydrolase n=1 Tax=Nannocystis pusilla TaxID=889268 RepID=UPI003DA6B935